MKRDMLQFRITATVGAILIAACILLTVNSLSSAHSYYGDYASLIEAGEVEIDPALPEGAAPRLTGRSDFYLQAAQSFSVRSVAAVFFTALLALAAVYFITGRLLRPLRELTRSVQAVDGQHLDHRVELEAARGEVLVLSETFNRMMQRLEEAFLMQKSFASNAAHELKTPLAIIKSSLQVLEMNPNPQSADYREFMQDTGESLERIIKTVDGLLTLANPDAAGSNQNVRLRQLLEKAARELSPVAQEHGVKISVSGEETAVRGDINLLYRAFYNLIENAVKYNRAGGSVAITLREQKGGAEVEVRDNGIGMEEEELAHIFEPFYRADKSRSQLVPGSGLGLAMVRLIVERHGGRIEVSSETGRGSAFTLMFKKA